MFAVADMPSKRPSTSAKLSKKPESQRAPQPQAKKHATVARARQREVPQSLPLSGEHLSAEDYRCAFEGLQAYASVLRRSADLLETLERSVSELVHRNGFDAAVLSSLVPGWPSLCSSAKSDLEETVIKTLADLAVQRTASVPSDSSSAEVPIHIFEDPAGELFDHRLRGFLQIPILVEERLAAVLLLAFSGAEMPTPLQLRMTAAMIQLLEATLQHLSKGNIDSADGKPEARISHLETLGRLAAGVAHDFNNLLQGLLGYASLLDMSVGNANPKVRGYIEGLEKEVIKGGSLSEQLLTLSRRGSPVSEPVDIAALVEEVAQLLVRTIDRRIEVSAQVAMPKLPLMIVRNDLVEAVTNLCLNARDLLPDGGSIKISASTLAASQIPFPIGESRAWSQSICIEVTAAVPDNQLGNLGEYWGFTRNASAEKALSGGSLRQVQALANRYRGYLTIFTNLLRGSTIRLYMPVEQ
jgi:signal transduction histidine kinase